MEFGRSIDIDEDSILTEIPSKRARVGGTDSETTSNDDGDEKLQRMASAFSTIIEVGFWCHFVIIISLGFTIFLVPSVSNSVWVKMLTEKDC